jgi:DNA-directed RNA polymerase subunit omega
MIVEPSVTDLLKLVNDRYELVIVTSKRARQLADGARILTDAKDKSVVTIAAKEVSEGKVKKVC